MTRYICLAFLILTFANCSSTKNEKKKNDFIENTTMELDSDVYFKIIGTEPFWNIQIDETKIVYQPADGQKIEFPYNVPAIDKNTETRTYTTMNGRGAVTIKLIKGFCTDGMSDKDYDYRAEVTIEQLKKTTKLKGCGYFVVEEALTGNWILKEIKTDKIKYSENSVIPFIEFDLENNRLSGNAGCNGFSSIFIKNKNEIQFNEIMLTKMFCENVDLESNFVDSLKEINKYKIEESKLKFYVNNHLVMVFEKK